MARSLGGIGAASVGMVVFALFAHRHLPWSLIGAAGLLAAAAAIAWTGFGTHTPADALGFSAFSLKTAIVCVLGGTLGVSAAFLHRRSLNLPLQSNEDVQWFVLVACLIGMTEELIYRGWLFGRARTFGWPAAVVVAAVAHGAYKAALFVSPSVPAAVDLPRMLVLTIAGGLVLGVLRASTGSVIPAMIAHAAFDFVVYRAVAEAPWWIWS